MVLLRFGGGYPQSAIILARRNPDKLSQHALEYKLQLEKEKSGLVSDLTAERAKVSQLERSNSEKDVMITRLGRKVEEQDTIIQNKNAAAAEQNATIVSLRRMLEERHHHPEEERCSS